MGHYGSCVVQGWNVLETDFDEHNTLITLIILSMADYRSRVRNLPGHLTPALLTSLIQSLIKELVFKDLKNNVCLGHQMGLTEID